MKIAVENRLLRINSPGRLDIATPAMYESHFQTEKRQPPGEFHSQSLAGFNRHFLIIYILDKAVRLVYHS